MEKDETLNFSPVPLYNERKTPPSGGVFGGENEMSESSQVHLRV
jgi:hypothetical protein